MEYEELVEGDKKYGDFWIDINNNMLGNRDFYGNNDR